ncbi:MAG: lysophospholipid acyltransferase family protein [Candidatus Gorgyraea atricola]|nr:lysophospholipid acyltransferase family protein [Candidatus Gorgyraea atricola]
MCYTFWRFVFFLFFKIFLRLKVSGRENFPKDGPVIVAPNHVSFLDPIIVGVAAPRKLNYLARSTLFRSKIFAKMLSWANVSPIKRETGDVNAFRLALNRLRQQKPVLVFPEGTRSQDGDLQEPKSGIGFLQVTSEANILPCYVKGSREAWPRHSKFPRFAHVSVHFGKPLRFEKDFSGSKKERYMHIAREVMQAISELKENSQNGQTG